MMGFPSSLVMKLVQSSSLYFTRYLSSITDSNYKIYYLVHNPYNKNVLIKKLTSYKIPTVSDLSQMKMCLVSYAP